MEYRFFNCKFNYGWLDLYGVFLDKMINFIGQFIELNKFVNMVIIKLIFNEIEDS